MRVLYIGIFSTEGGMNKNFMALGKSLSQKIELFSVVGNAANVQSIVTGEKGRLILNVNRNRPTTMFSFGNCRKVRQYAVENKIDVILTVSNSPANIMLTAALKGYPQIAFLHNPFLHENTKPVPAFFETILNRVYKKYCEKLVVASRVQMDQVIRSKEYSSIQEKFETIYLGMQTNMLYDLPTEEETVDVLYFGRIEHYKGLDILVQAMQGNTTRMYSCIIIGKGNITYALGKMSKMPENIKFINEYVPDKELAHYIKRCKVFVMPYREATGTQIIQTVMYYGKPIIATKVGCFPEYIENGKTGVLVEPESVMELQKAIERLVPDEEERKKIGEAGRKILNEKFNNDRIAEHYVKCITELNNKQMSRLE